MINVAWAFVAFLLGFMFAAFCAACAEKDKK